MFGNTNNLNISDHVKNVDNRILNWLVDLHTTLNKDKIDLRKIDNLVNILKHFDEDNRDDYVNSLLYPETVMGKKVPTLFPIPTTTFQMHLVCANVATNASGNLAFTWNPFFLCDSSAWSGSSATDYTSFYTNNNASLTGSSSNANFVGQSLFYSQLPVNIYGSYRLVSASVIVSYVGRMDIVSGVVGIGILFLLKYRSGIE